jgi:hypothetical protein
MLNRKELFHRDLSEQNENIQQSSTTNVENVENSQNNSPNSENSNNSGSERGQRNITAIGLPVRTTENTASRVQNRRIHTADHMQTNQGNRRAPIQSKTVKRVQGKAFTIMNDVQVILS